MGSTDINLLQTKAVLSEHQQAILSHVRIVSLGAVAFAVAVGILTGIVYLILSESLKSAERTKSQVQRSITIHSRKEALYVSLKDRLPVMKKAMSSQRLWGGMLGDVFAVAQPPVLKSISVSELDVMDIAVSSGSLEETAVIVGETLRLVDERKIASPQLSGLRIAEDGTVNFTLSFIPVL